MKVIAVFLVAIMLAVAGVVFYFVGYKANQPMQVAEAQAIASGITYNEFLEDRFAGWKARDEKMYASGESQSKSVCVLTQQIMFPKAIILEPGLRIFFTRQYPGTDLAEHWLAGAHYVIAPANLNGLDAWWWQIENESWWYWAENGGKGADFCRLGNPKRPESASK